MKIPFAEDDKDISKAVAALLTRNPYTVDTVYNGEDALDYITVGDYDAVILDIMMPKMNGLELAIAKAIADRHNGALSAMINEQGNIVFFGDI